MAATCPQVRACCLYISLRTGAKLFGFVSLLGCFLLVLLSAWEIVAVSKYAPEEFEQTTVVLSIDILVQVIHMAASVLLLLSVYQERAKLMVPWLITSVVIAILEVVFLPSFIGRMYGIHYHAFTVDWIVLTIFMILDDIYGWIVVYSYYMTLAPQSQGRGV